MPDVRAIGLWEFVEKVGARRIRKRGAELPGDHPLRESARALVLRELENCGVLLLLDREEQEKRAAYCGEVRDDRGQREAEQERALWERGGTDLPGLIAVFDRHNTAAAFELASTADGAPMGWQQTTPEKSAAVAERQIKHGRAVPALRPKGGHCILGVVEANAAKLAKRFALPDTLSWSSDGWRFWLYTGAPSGASVVGDTACVIASDHTHGAVRTATMKDATWHVKPNKALPKGEARLPRLPEELRELVRGVGAGGGKALDTLLA